MLITVSLQLFEGSLLEQYVYSVFQAVHKNWSPNKLAITELNKFSPPYSDYANS